MELKAPLEEAGIQTGYCQGGLGGRRAKCPSLENNKNILFRKKTNLALVQLRQENCHKF